ncbi:hypothetical protein B0H14DRAFT_2589344 [Mycena olivaceomarginata]|nr:hypothetical protein B0H14DRAFT_2589344 [Mycena olivaceomarginata]
MLSPNRRPNYIKIWTPRLRLFEEDKAVFDQEPFATVFDDFKTRRMVTRNHPNLWQQLSKTLSEHRWELHLTDWLCFTLGADIVDNMPADAVARGGKLFLDVLYTRFFYNGSLEGEGLAYKLLEAAQNDNFKTHFRAFVSYFLLKKGELPADFALSEDLDRRETWDGDSEAGERDSDWEDYTAPYSDDEGDDPFDTDFVPTHYSSASDMDASDDESDLEETFLANHMSPDGPAAPDLELPCFVGSPTHNALSVLPVVMPVSTAEGTDPQCWAQHIRDFFYPEINADRGEQEERSAQGVVNDLVSMRAVKKTVYTSQSFQCSLVESGLFKLLQDIACPGNLLERTHRDVEESFRWLEWKTSYAELIVRWVKPTLTLEEYKDSCDKWLVPCLRKLEYKRIEGWNSVIVYRELMRLPVFRNPGDCREELDRMDPRLAEVIRQTSHHRWFQNTLRKELHRADHPVVPPPLPPAEPSKMTKSAKRRINKKARDEREQVPKRAGSHQRGLQVKKEVLGNPKAKQVKLAKDGDPKPCPKCFDLPLEERCIRVVRKEEKVPQRQPKRLPPLRYYHPIKDLGMQVIEHRPDVYTRCGRDIVRFIWRRHDGTKEMVGGVRFKVFSERVLQYLINAHRLVKVRTIRRRDIMQRWAYGTMTATGSRQAAGRRKGDTYGPYACHRGDTPDDIKAFFSEAVDSRRLD